MSDKQETLITFQISASQVKSWTSKWAPVTTAWHALGVLMNGTASSCKG
jgi:hypothetical protein